MNPVVASARLINFSGLPLIYLEVGNLDIFRDETISYTQYLLQAAVATELHLWPGVPHTFDLISPVATVSQLAWQHRVRVIRSL